MLAELKDRLHILNNRDDENLRALLKQAHGQIQAYCGEFDPLVEEQGKELMFEYVRFAWNGATEHFYSRFLPVLSNFKHQLSIKGKQQQGQGQSDCEIKKQFDQRITKLESDFALLADQDGDVSYDPTTKEFSYFDESQNRQVTIDVSNLNEDDVVGLIKQHVDITSVNDRLTTLENKPDDTRVQALEDKVNSLQATGGGGGLTQEDVDDILTETFFGFYGDGTTFEAGTKPGSNPPIPTRGRNLIESVVYAVLKEQGLI